jgi:hypothetical protein
VDDPAIISFNRKSAASSHFEQNLTAPVQMSLSPLRGFRNQTLGYSQLGDISLAAFELASD